MALNDKGLDPIEAQGDGRQVSGRGVYVHDGSGSYLEAVNQPQADAFLRQGFRLATPKEAKEYQESVIDLAKRAKEDELDMNPVLQSRYAVANRTEREQALADAAYQRGVEANQPQAQEQPKTVDDQMFDKDVEKLNGKPDAKSGEAVAEKAQKVAENEEKKGNK